MDDEEEWMTPTQYAVHRGCSPTTVYKRIKEGSVKQRGDKKIHAGTADENWNLTGQSVRVDGTGPRVLMVADQSKLIESKTSIMQDKARNEKLKAEREEIKLAQLRGQLINKAQVLSHIESISRRNADSWLVFAQEVSVELADEIGCDPDMLFAHLDNAVRVQLKTVSELEFEIE